METVFWVIVTMSCLRSCTVSDFMKRKEALRRTLIDMRPIQMNTELICRREEKPLTTLPKRFAH